MLNIRSAAVATALGAAALITAIGSAAPGHADQGGVKLDPALQSYRKVSEPIVGNLNSIGSDTMNNLMTYWGEEFIGLYDDVNLQIEGKGSSTAPPALIEGTSQFGPMSREMKSKEVDAFEAKFGYKPTLLKTSLDALAVFVHRDNPVKSLSLTQLDSIFSSTRKRGGAEVDTWDALGVGGAWSGKPINVYGRNSASGTYGYFKSVALKKGDYKDSVKEQPGSAAVVQGVTEDPAAIGYSGIGYRTSGVRAVPISKKDGGTAYAADYENVASGKYPISRFLNLYVNKHPSRGMSPVVREFCRFIFSKQGQQVVLKAGYLPLTERQCAEQRALIK